MLLSIFFIFISILILQLFYYLIVFRKFAFTKPTLRSAKIVPISVIVCAKNEEENLKKFLPFLVDQDYKNYEIVLVDDASTDDTIEIYEEFERQYSNVKIVRVRNNEAFWGNKKFALTMGIKAATNEHLLFIDADCYPKSNSWISTMSSQFTNEKTIVLGYGSYEKVSNSLLNKLIRFETLFIAMQYLGWANFGKPYMGVGRNLAYTKQQFFDVNGFVNHMKIPSGDDDLFVNEAATALNTATCYNIDSITVSIPKASFSEWIDQKRRHISTAKHYKFFDKVQLFIFYLSQVTFITLAIILFAFQYQWVTVFGLVGLRYLVCWVTLSTAAEKLDEKDVTIWYPIFEVVLIIVQFFTFITNLFSKKPHWK